MPNVLKPRSFSFSAKATITLIILALFLLTILFALIIPKMQKEQLEYTKDQIEKIILTTKEQVDVAGKAISIQSKLERSETRYKIVTKLYEIKEKAKNFQEAKKLFLEDKTIDQCSFLLENSLEKFDNFENKKLLKAFNNNPTNKWLEHEFELNYKTLDRKSKYFSYTMNLNFGDSKINILCSNGELNKNHASFEEGIKINVQKAFSLMQKFHKGKSYLMWINPNFVSENDRPLYRENKAQRKKVYSISNMSNVDNIHTGNLTAKQIFDNKDKEPLPHYLNGRRALSWISNLSEEGDTYVFLLVTTIYLDDLHNHIDSAFWKILPASLIALLLAIFAGFFMFKRQFRTINILAKTAKEVNAGNRTIRSNVVGKDDIGTLGIAFDSMLDSLQKNIKTLDFKVEQKTKELQDSLDEKETLLKEIHHRVKNNLALTISLIKLQQAKIEDSKTQVVLKDIQERIYTMELMHRKLYESTNLNSIDFSEYVSNLAHDISNTYNYENEVKIDINVDKIFLTIEKAMPCGLIINEIVTNSFKYAFKDNSKAKLEISMKKEKERYILILKDNGKGLDKNIDISSSQTLGLKLINTISKLQLNGEIEYFYGDGAVFRIYF